MYESFQDGSIIKLLLENFQTYSNATFTFHPQLNFIAGPNGCGKSSVANAIAFIFGGNTSTIGKTKDIAEYVNFNADEAKVEATLKFRGKTVILKRIFNKLNKKSLFYVNETSKKVKEYQDFIKLINVDINNLCQFLPQEKVSQFAALNAEQLLKSTLNSQSNTNIYKLKEELELLENEKEELEKAIETTKSKKEVINQNLINMDKEMDKLKEKTRREELIKNMNLKIKWLKYEAVSREYKELKERIKIMEAEINKKEKEIKKIEEEIDKVKKSNEMKRLEIESEKIKEMNEELKLKMKKINEKHQEIEYFESDKNSLNKKKEMRQSEIGQTKALIENIKNKVNSLVINEVKKVKIDEDEIRKLDEEKILCKGERDELKSESENICNKSEMLQRKLLEFNKEDARRMEYLKRYHLDTYKGVIWLRQNRDKFSQEIIEPPILEVRLKNPKYATEVETFLSFQLLSSFICKNPSDFSLLLKILKDEMKLSINAIESFDRRESNTINNNDLMKLGFEGMLIDFIDAREEIVNFLCTAAHFHSIPVSKKNIDENLIFEKYSNIKRMAIGGKYIEIKRSIYDKNDFVTSETNLKSTKLFQGISIEESKKIENEIDELNKTREKNQKKYKEIQERIENIEKRTKTLVTIKSEYLEKLRENFNEKQHKKNKWKHQLRDMKNRLKY